MTAQHIQQPALTIGAVSKATGIPTDTLRTWERRYGFPSPQRSPSGQRLYSTETVDTLRLITQGLDQGHRPSILLRKSPSDLLSLLNPSLKSLSSAAPLSEEYTLPEPIATWMQAVKDLDGDALDEGLRSSWYQLTVVEFLSERIAPFLHAVGEEWSRGELTVMHEHFASERLRDFLSNVWRPLNRTSKGPCIVLACLPNEHHHLGLHMAAIIAAVAGLRILFLGANTPIEDIAVGCTQRDAVAVLVSVARSAPLDATQRALHILRHELDPNTQLIVGGAGAPPPTSEDIQRMSSLDGLFAWAKELALSHQSVTVY